MALRLRRYVRLRRLNLADLYSYLESLRRGTKGLLANPSGTLNQWGSQIKEDLGKYDQGNKVALGLLGNSDPILNTSPGEAAWQNNAGIGTNLGLLGLHIAYHGTPHTVDKFDMSKVGTGEGAQAYGHGLYFAENPGVASVYKDALSTSQIVGADGKVIYSPPSKGDYSTAGSPEHRAMSALQYAHDTQSSSPYAFARNVLRRTDDADAAEAAIGLLGKWQEAGAVPKPSGNLYKVDINADPAHYLDWDKPLSQQTEQVQSALQSLPQSVVRKATGGYDQFPGRVRYDQTTGAHVYQMLGGGPEATQALREAGVPGIKYKDAGSRAVDGGTHNYVVFDDSLINNLGAQP